MKSIYKLTNKINNKIYIGLTIQGVRTRFIHHLYEARSGSNFPIHRAIRKYGEENFIVEVIIESEDFTDEFLKKLEKYYIKLNQSNNSQKGYNLTEGGDGTLGKLHSNETKEKIRNKATGKSVSKETKLRMSKTHIQRKESEEWKEWFDKYGNGKSASISVKLEKDNIIYEFKSKLECFKFLNLSATTFYKRINRGERTIKGYNLIDYK